MDGSMDEWMDGWMDGWMNGWMDGWMDRWIDTKKIKEPRESFYFYGKAIKTNSKNTGAGGRIPFLRKGDAGQGWQNAGCSQRGVCVSICVCSIVVYT